MFSSNTPCLSQDSNNELVTNIDKSFKKVAIVCIGTDRSTEDSYGPLVGYFLSKYKNLYSFDVYGTIRDPVHALNLGKVLSSINNPDTLIIAIDSALGKLKNIGYIMTSYDPIYPKSGVGKKLLPVGDIQLSGIVNMNGFMSSALLQCIRLSLVYRMAQMTVWVVIYVCSQSPLKEKIYTCKRQNISLLK